MGLFIRTCLLVLGGGLAASQALAQTSVRNSATVTLPSSMACAAPVGGVCAWSDSRDTTVTAPVLTLTKTASATSFTVGTAASYTLRLTNGGTAATTTTATITDTVPAGLMLGTLPAGCTGSGQTVTCAVPAGLAADGGQAAFVIPVTPTAASVADVSNTASVSGGGDAGCPAAGRCTSTVATPIGRAADLSIAKTVDNATPSRPPWPRC